MYSSFQNIVHTAKQMQYTLDIIFSDFLNDVFLIFFMNIEMSMELYIGEKPVAQLLVDTTDGLPVLNGTAVVDAMYSI